MKKQKKFDWLTYKLPLSLDFFYQSIIYFIECQGRQHFIPVSVYGSENEFIKTQERDLEKYKNVKTTASLQFIILKEKMEKFLNEDIIKNEEELIKKFYKNG